MNKIQSEIIGAIEQLVSRKVETAGYDKTNAGTVLEVLGDNQYRVLINGSQHTLYCAVNMTFTVGNAIWITIPQNDMSKAYICGRRYK